MIAVLTKYEALVDRVKGEYTERQVTKRDTLNYAKKNVFDPLKNIAHPPAAIIHTHRELALLLLYNNNINFLTF